MGIVGLGRTYPHRLVNSACERAMTDGLYSYKHVKALTERLVAEALAAIGDRLNLLGLEVDAQPSGPAALQRVDELMAAGKRYE